jgi:hypothetical protein
VVLGVVAQPRAAHDAKPRSQEAAWTHGHGAAWTHGWRTLQCMDTVYRYSTEEENNGALQCKGYENS